MQLRSLGATGRWEPAEVMSFGVQGALPGNQSDHPATFVQFSAAACNEDGAHPPWTDSGHDCPFKSGVESPWILTAAKLYAQQAGRLDSHCAQMLYGTAEDSLQHDPQIEKIVFKGKPSMDLEGPRIPAAAAPL